MSEVRDRYPDPGTFRTALTQRLRRLAESSPWTLAELQRQFAYDGFRQRLNAGDDGWVLKGAAALLALARHATSTSIDEQSWWKPRPR